MSPRFKGGDKVRFIGKQNQWEELKITDPIGLVVSHHKYTNYLDVYAVSFPGLESLLCCAEEELERVE